MYGYLSIMLNIVISLGNIYLYNMYNVEPTIEKTSVNN